MNEFKDRLRIAARQITSTANRRGMLLGAAALSALAVTVPRPAAATTLPAAGSSCHDGSNPDAEIIHLCADHMEAVDAYNGSGSNLEPKDDPLWRAVEAIELQLDGLTSRTMAGLVAKAQVALHFARQPDGYEDFSASYTGDWPERVVRDLLALHGDVA